MSFIDDVLLFTDEYEAPKRFYYWAALTAISAILKDTVWFDMGSAYKLYPNIYVLLYGPSGVRKGPPIAMAEKLVKRVNNTRVINGRASIEAIIKELGTFKTRPDKTMDKDSSGFVVASELSSSIIANPSAMDIMTNLYDRIYNEGEWEYKLKVGESHKLIRPTLTWLAGSNEALFKEFLPEKNIHGGLIGRMFIVNEQKENTINSLMYKPKHPLDDNAYNTLVKQLMPLKQLSGEFEMSSEVRDGIDAWYKRLKTEIAPELNDQTGFVARMEDFLIKIAMLISCARRMDKKIKMEDVLEATANMMSLVSPTQKISRTTQREDKSKIQKKALIMIYLANHDITYRKQLLRDIGLQVSPEDVDEVVNHLFAMDALEQGRHGNDISYRLKTENPKVAKSLEHYRKG